MEQLNITSGPSSTLIAHRAIQRGIRIYSDEKQRLTLQRGRRRVWFDGAQSNINKVLAQRCVRYKDVTARLLRSHRVNAPQNVVFAADQVRAAWDWAAYELPVVVKPPNGGKGDLVHVGVTDSDHFEQAFAAVAEASGEVLVERFVEGVEHRVLLIYGKVAAAQRRVPAHVIGNGRSSVRKLIRKKNRLRTKSNNAIYVDAQIPVDDVVVRELASAGMTLDSVPARGQRVWLRSNSNVSSGGEAHDATDDLTAEEIAMAEEVAKAVPGLRVAGLDMLLPRDGKGDAPHILEVNSSPLMTGHHYPWAGESRDVAAMLVEAMFPEDERDAAPVGG
ncbi:ATP-grasp domain-containing protein [Nesterenkonia sp. NBAIMH1]|uniref:ATP-grasp domain-containing protein n=1 Tax=Nesterenkonia sp. NBAIMH1 TaxID=2600320 RepID=UPI00143CF298|nr:ATP-grasp domain-containing protein [Nesterenkonia sp. NBAIMH1]